MEFKKVDLASSRGAMGRGVMALALVPSNKTVRVSTSLVHAAKIESGDRFDLYRCGNTFMLKREKVGVIRAVFLPRAGMYLRNTDMYYTLATANKNTNKRFDVDITDEGLLFTIGGEDGDTRK